MNEMLGYVFGSLENNRRDILNLKKCMNNQIKINKLNVFSGFCSIAAILCFQKYNDMKIKKLEEEIELLKGQNTNEMEG